MPPLQTNSVPPPPPNLKPPPEISPQNSIDSLIAFSVFTVLSAILFAISKKFPQFKKLRWISLLTFVTAIVAGFIYFTSSSPLTSFTSRSDEKIKPLAAPTDVEEKIQGYWGTRLFIVTASLETDIPKMKQVGINTITMAPQLEHKGDGNITEQPGTEQELKKAINTAHEAGFRVLLDPAPMTTEFNPKTEDPNLFVKNMKKISLKYAKLAEEFNVEYYSPLTEPVAQLGSVKADEFMQSILPEVKKRYSGKVVFKKQSNDLYEQKQIEEDHSTIIEFMITGDHIGVSFGKPQAERISLEISSNKSSLTKYTSHNQSSLGKKQIKVSKDEWHTLKIDQKGKRTIYTLDDQSLFDYQDSQDISGSYTLNTGGVTIRKISITNSKGISLISQNNIGDNWSGMHGWNIDDGQLVGRQASNPAKNAGELNLIHDIDFSGYDMLAIHLWKEGTVQSLSEYRQEVKYLLNKTRQQADSDGVPEILVGEFGGTTLESVQWGTNRIKTEIGRPMTGAELAAVAQMVVTEAENTTSGYLYNGWDIEGQGIDQIPEVEQVIKAWYTTH